MSAGDREQAAAILMEDGVEGADPVVRRLVGHAGLARNRSNDATLLFERVESAHSKRSRSPSETVSCDAQEAAMEAAERGENISS